MDTHAFDAIVIGAGIAGATVAAHLSADRRVALIEAEEAAGYHSTGRSAAIWIQNYGPPDVRVLTGLSRGFFEHPARGLHRLPYPGAPPRGVPGAVRAARAPRSPARRRHRPARGIDPGNHGAGPRAAPGLRRAGGDRGRRVRHGRGGAAPGLPAPAAHAGRRAGPAQPHRPDRAPRRAVARADERGRHLHRARRRQHGRRLGRPRRGTGREWRRSALCPSAAPASSSTRRPGRRPDGPW